MRRSRFSRLAPGLAAAALLAALAPAQSTLRVPADFASVQAAIDAAVNGDEVLVSDGTYLEVIDLSGKAIAVRSENGAAATTLDGGGQALFVVTIASGEGLATRLEGFTITGGVGTTVGSIGAIGGGMRIDAASPTLRDLILAGNVGLEGGGMSLKGGSMPLIEDCVFIDNLAATGGGLYSFISSPTLVNVAFLGNRANSNGGGLLALGSSITIQDAEFAGNDTSGLGAGMYLGHLVADISGVRAEGNGTVEALGYNSFSYSPFGGGGVYATSVSGQIRNSTFVDNAAAAGAGVYLAANSTVEVVNALITGNQAGIAGAGVYVNSASPRVVNCTIADNFPGGVYTTYNAFPVVANSILVRNTNAHYVGCEIYGNGITAVSYSIVEGPILIGALVGAGVIDVDPQLDTNYRQLAGSPTIDAGSNEQVPGNVLVDLDGNARFRDDPATPDTGSGQAPLVDFGAFEFQPATPLQLRGRRRR